MKVYNKYALYMMKRLYNSLFAVNMGTLAIDLDSQNSTAVTADGGLTFSAV